MSQVYVISDLHIGHERIIEFAGNYRDGDTFMENVEHIKQKWNKRVTKKDKVFVLGDVCMNIHLMPLFDELHGTKILIRGNHDDFDMSVYTKYFKEIHGLYRYKRKGFSCWMSHAPIHPDELRGRINVHGHVHQNSIRVNNMLDDRYVNACVENSDGGPIPMDDIVKGIRTWGKVQHFKAAT